MFQGQGHKFVPPITKVYREPGSQLPMAQGCHIRWGFGAIMSISSASGHRHRCQYNQIARSLTLPCPLHWHRLAPKVTLQHCTWNSSLAANSSTTRLCVGPVGADSTCVVGL